MIEKENHNFTGSSNGDNSFLFGHKEQIAYLLNCINTNQIPNAWLFHGPSGIGKASLALNVAKVLSNIDFQKKRATKPYLRKRYKKSKCFLTSNQYFLLQKKMGLQKEAFS